MVQHVSKHCRMVHLLLPHTHVVSLLLLAPLPLRPWHHPGHRHHLLSCHQPTGKGPRSWSLPILVRLPSMGFGVFAHSCIPGPAPSAWRRRFLGAAAKSCPHMLPASQRGTRAVTPASIHTLLAPSQRRSCLPCVLHRPRRLKLLDTLLAPQQLPLPAQSPPRRPPAPNPGLLHPGLR